MAHGYKQQQGIDFDETFSLVVKPTIIRTVFSAAFSSRWSLQQLDVKNTFLHGALSKEVYKKQPPDFVSSLSSSSRLLSQQSNLWP